MKKGTEHKHNTQVLKLHFFRNSVRGYFRKKFPKTHVLREVILWAFLSFFFFFFFNFLHKLVLTLLVAQKMPAGPNFQEVKITVGKVPTLSLNLQMASLQLSIRKKYIFFNRMRGN